MYKKLTIKIALACGIAVTGLFGAMIGSPSKASAATPESLDLLSFGKDFIGTPYQFGAAAGVTNTFDCSSFVQYIFQESGVKLPRTSSSQANVGEKVDKAYLSVGDLVFFKTGGGGISHVAIYAGNSKILHASSSQGVTLSNMNSSYWTKAYVTARRVL
ncbi:C40 family peptidase [Cohnella terricola]|uniref:NlpC/P60 family protein n=1 Tax=Cohnella terricola TaxID=1289167 RepID=A0A559JTR7_9BACL|nr:C40 family peptidase [Cohnella terricola]TVY03276.1 NlpC/P60 family protein [Cohnella terricola]